MNTIRCPKCDGWPVITTGPIVAKCLVCGYTRDGYKPIAPPKAEGTVLAFAGPDRRVGKGRR